MGVDGQSFFFFGSVKVGVTDRVFFIWRCKMAGLVVMEVVETEGFYARGKVLSVCNAGGEEIAQVVCDSRYETWEGDEGLSVLLGGESLVVPEALGFADDDAVKALLKLELERQGYEVVEGELRSYPFFLFSRGGVMCNEKRVVGGFDRGF